LEKELKTNQKEKEAAKNHQNEEAVLRIQNEKDALKKEIETLQNSYEDEKRMHQNQINEVKKLQNEKEAMKMQNENAVLRIQEEKEALEIRSKKEIQDKTEELKKSFENEIHNLKKELNKFQSEKLERETYYKNHKSLALAISKNDQDETITLLRKPNVNINQGINNILENVIGPVLIIAIQNGNGEMIKMLAEAFIANINQEFIWEGKQSTPLIFAMNCVVK